MEQLQSFLSFAEKSPTAFHAVEQLRQMLDAEGFRALRESDPWLVDAGDRCYVVRNDSSIIAFMVPETGFAPFRIAAAHSDSPSFKLKPVFEDAGEAYVRLNVEKYGGMIMYSWMDRPLSVAGRLAVREGDRAVSRLVDLGRDAVLIPSLPIHFNRDVNDGFAFNPQVDLMPLYGDASAAGGLLSELAEAAGVDQEDILGHDLFLYSRLPAAVWGADKAFFSCSRIDDLECAWACMRAFSESASQSMIHVCAVFDNEEVGSLSRQGADSDFLRNVLTRVGLSLGASWEELLSAFSAGFMISADNAHALHPNRADAFDKQNRVYMNKGVVIKHNANQKYTTDALTGAEFELLCRGAEVPVQHFANRSDQRGGSTLGNLANSHVSMPTLDIGLAQLAMHSLVETAGVKDLEYLLRAMASYWER